MVMFKSVFIKYMAVFLIILTFSFLILTMIVTALIYNYSIDEKQETMYNTANTAGQIFQMKFNWKNQRLDQYIENDKIFIDAELKEYTKFAKDSFIFITDAEGRILTSTLDGSPDDSPFQSGEVPMNIIETIIQGNDISRFQTLGGVFREAHLFFPKQIMIGKETAGILFVCSNSSAINFFVNKTINTIIMSCLWVFLATIVIVYIMTEKIIGPIRIMNRAAQSFSTGQFDVRVPVRGNDEIASLALAFNNMAASLAENEEMSRAFVSNVSHDLRTPMTSIGGFIDRILDGTIPEDKHKYYLEIVSDEVKRLSKLITSMLDLTRIQAGERRFTKTRFDVCELARIIIISCESRIEEKKMNVEFNGANDNIYVSADKDAIHQVMYNLIDNAIKFTPEEGLLKITISFKDKKVQVSVYNSGMGIEKSDAARIFDRFYKTDPSRGLDKTGVGLGLSIVKTIISGHGEKISVRSEYGEYCEFIFTLQKAPEHGK